MTKKKHKFINASDFAHENGFSYTSVKRWLQKGLIKGAKKIEAGNTHVYLIPEDAIYFFKPPKRGRPKKQ